VADVSSSEVRRVTVVRGMLRNSDPGWLWWEVTGGTGSSFFAKRRLNGK
jgi:hypothetical protein